MMKSYIKKEVGSFSLLIQFIELISDSLDSLLNHHLSTSSTLRVSTIGTPSSASTYQASIDIRRTKISECIELTPTSAYSWTNFIVAHPIMYPNFSLIRLTFFQLVESWMKNPLILVIEQDQVSLNYQIWSGLKHFAWKFLLITLI